MAYTAAAVAAGIRQPAATAAKIKTASHTKFLTAPARGASGRTPEVLQHLARLTTEYVEGISAEAPQVLVPPPALQALSTREHFKRLSLRALQAPFTPSTSSRFSLRAPQAPFTPSTPCAFHSEHFKSGSLRALAAQFTAFLRTLPLPRSRPAWSCCPAGGRSRSWPRVPCRR